MTAEAPLADLARRYDFNLKTIAVIAEAFEPADWGRRPDGGGNSAHWILGHLAASRRGVRRVLGEPLEREDWEVPFGRGAHPEEDESADYPSVETLTADLESSGKRITEILAWLGAAELASRVEHTFPDGSDTLGGAAGFLYFHETYHVGQLGLLRRLAGKPGFV